MAAYTVYWPKDYLKQLNKEGDHGPLRVVYGGPHMKMPAISKVRKGDVIYIITIAEGSLCVLAKLPVEKIEPAMEYLVREVGELHSALLPPHTALWSVENGKGHFRLPEGYAIDENGNIQPEIKNVVDAAKLQPVPHQFHQVPQTCCAKLAASGIGTEFLLRPAPEEWYPRLLFGVKGKETPMKLDKNGAPAIHNISCSVRHMTDSTQELLESLFEKECFP